MRRRSLWVVLSASLALLFGSTGIVTAGASHGSQSSIAAKSLKQTGAYQTTVRYVAQFYPLLFTYNQAQTFNHFIGPARVTPLYHAVVAINVDTLYASTALNLTDQPVILKVPATQATYSILQLDPYGNVLQQSALAPTTSGGTYVLYGPHFTGKLPAGVTPVAEKYNYSNLLFRADKWSSSGQDTSSEAGSFREGLFTQPLCSYLHQSCPAGVPAGGYAQILPERQFAAPVKSIVDGLAHQHQLIFLAMLQTAVHAPNTPPMPPAVQALSNRFDSLFSHLRGNAAGFAAGVRAAHALIIRSYLTHTERTHWVHFNNIGDWGNQVVQRSAITEFCQYCNSIATAGYWHAFRDGQGKPLNGGKGHRYVLTFRKGQIPTATRFWSVTAYTPQAIELIPTGRQKYGVASYTQGLHYGKDGSLRIYISRMRPRGVPKANWLPVSRLKFNLMLRIYGTTSSAKSYVPPAIREVR